MKYLMGIAFAVVSLMCNRVQGAETQEVSVAVDKQLGVNAARYGVVGQSVLILKNHQIIYRGVQGYANLELGVKVKKQHIFPAYSVTKLFTSVLVMQLVERGQVALTDSIVDHLKYLPDAWKQVTVEHLLSHTSGIPRYFDAVLESGAFLRDKRAVYASLEEKPPHFETGTSNRYNNTNFLLLASLLEHKTGKPYMQLVKDVILDPLALQHTGHASARDLVPNTVTSYQGDKGKLKKNTDIDWPEYTFSHSALYSTPEELGKFMTALMTGRFVKPQTLAALLSPMVLTNGQAGSYAFGFEYAVEDGMMRIGHDGGNRVKARHYAPLNDGSDSYTLIYMTNGNENDVWTDVLADSVMSIVAPQVFQTARLNEQFMAAAFTRDRKAMEQVYQAAVRQHNGNMQAVEQFILYRAYGLRYGSGPASSIDAFEFLVQKFPESARAKRGLKYAQDALLN